MECMQSNYHYRMAQDCFQAWYAQAPAEINDMRVEEEDRDWDSDDIPIDKDDLGGWWNRFSQQHRYPLYCMVLATEADTNVALIVDK